DPYLAGVGLGLVLLAAFVVMGRGLGASGAFTSAVTAGVAAVAPEHAASNRLFGHYLAGGAPLRDWLVFEIVGVAIGGLLSALAAGRFRFAIERGPRVTDRSRLLYAFGGGAVMGVGAKLARGCTSGQALTGGALLSVGSWLFILGAFAAGYLAAPLFRRQWT
ncbi:MAG: YeeE/YedE family protein, partial [Gemmatimonadetes bacterium]|nr:YeeE/YedE family protein [Gemmatimonadota bacterium]NIQ59581.1 YeeE/YedE family protein [Gemmatimonadota bacterium]NIU79790.1 YeeE/YedE family protein [Gammaproteobacteria bacterium]NIX48295.1 YeeE/YedE family protein [Gemmatimonadota bacterium]NIY12740.1 YeeE/YedE family protein [Gemmatimonadota bacterium]